MEKTYQISEPKPIQGGVVFNLALNTNFGVIYIVGLRIVKGVILFPAYKNGTRYFPVAYGNETFTDWLYQVLIDEGFNERFNLDLRKKELCMGPVKMPPLLYTSLFP